MKRIIFILQITLVLISCGDNKKPQEEDIKKYPWIESFVFEYKDYRGINHNLDIGTYSFSFKTKLPTIDSYFAATDSVAIENDWTILVTKKKERTYKKNIDLYKASTGLTYINLVYSEENERIILTSEINKK